MDVFSFIVFCIEIPVHSVDSDQMPHLAASDQSLHCSIISPNWFKKG